MSRKKQRLLIRQFLGLGLSGESESQPLRPLGKEFSSFCRDGTQNLHTPAGSITNSGAGYVKQADKPANATTWDFLGYMLRTDGNGYQFGVSNGRMFDQEQLTNEWTEYVDKTGLSEGPWTGAQMWDWFFLANGTDNPIVFYGGQEPEDWLLDPPSSPPTISQNAGVGIDPSAGWSYRYVYRRSSGPAAGWLSPPSDPSDEDTQGWGTIESIDVVVTGTADTSIDKIDIYRNEAGGLFRFVASIDNPGATTDTYVDSTPQAVLSSIELPTIEAIDPFQFDLVAVHGGVVFAGGIVEDGVRRIGRVRTCFPGQPWRWDSYDFTDEIEGDLTALVSIEAGVLAFTGQSVHLIRPIGGGHYAVDKTGHPGTPNRFTAVPVRGGAAWLSGRNIWLLQPNRVGIISDPTGTSSFTMEQVAASSIEPLLKNLVNLRDIWLSYHGDLNYILVGLSGLSLDTPPTTLAYDMERAAWWRFSYSGDKAVRVANVTSDIELGHVLLGQSDGTLIRIFDGHTANGGDLKPLLRAGTTSLFLPHTKKVLYVEFRYDVTTDVVLDATWELDRGSVAAGGQVVVSEPAAGDLLSVDPADTVDTPGIFVLDRSRMGQQSRELARVCIGKRGRYLGWTLAARGQGVLDLAGVEVAHQPVVQ